MPQAMVSMAVGQVTVTQDETTYRFKPSKLGDRRGVEGNRQDIVLSSVFERVARAESPSYALSE